MKNILGITAEYDPFHSGHAYQIAQVRQQVQPEAIVCVMSGNFTQRGEPAVLDKWTRAKIAVRQGVDLVFELPFMYACNRAEKFAEGAVDLLVSAGVDQISFGCEAEQPEDLLQLVDGQINSAQQAEEMTRDFMKAGYSRAKAAEMTSRKLFGDELTDLMLAPNNILALEYLKRTRWWEEAKGLRIHSVPIRRFGSGYRSANPEEGFAGGTAIRQMLAAGDDITAYLSYDRKGLVWVDQAGARQKLYELIRGIILRSTPEQLAQVYCVGEGMEHRLLKEAKQQETFDAFLSAMISKRYTAAAIRRIMIYLLMNVEEMPRCAPYGRVLAASSAGRRLLRQLSDALDSHLPESAPPLTIISGNGSMTGIVEPMRESILLDARATDLFNLICGRDIDACSDYRQQPYITG